MDNNQIRGLIPFLPRPDLQRILTHILDRLDQLEAQHESTRLDLVQLDSRVDSIEHNGDQAR